jgi:hypothetical protein
MTLSKKDIPQHEPSTLAEFSDVILNSRLPRPQEPVTRRTVMKCDICKVNLPAVETINPALSLCPDCFIELDVIRSLAAQGKKWEVVTA